MSLRESEVLLGPDPAAFGPALARLGVGVARHPLNALRHATRLTTALATAAAQTTARSVGWQGDAALQPAPGDRRFTDPAWHDHPWFMGQQQAYLALARCLRDLAGSTGLDRDETEKAEVAVDLLLDALAPTNTLWGNPAALRIAVESRGASVLKGLANLADDVVDNDARPRQVDRSAFRVAENLACTPGKVVFRNDLIELLQYEPATPDVHEVPLLLSPPWINRYYIMDLAPGRSFVEWAVSHGHTTFTISYRNPEPGMGHLRLQDYLHDGLGTALEVVRAITGAPQANVAGLCVGGTLAVMLLAWQAHDTGATTSPVRSLTLLNTLIDFSQPGRLGAFTDAEAVARVEQRMAETGVLDGRDMAATFDALRPNDLIWNYVGSGWLMGEPPPAFDILAWNADPTRLPAATHSEYLRSMYLENRLARNEMEMAGRRLDLGAVDTETYVLAAKEDHITPWLSSYATTGLLGGDVRFVLSSSGHIAGIVNPPGNKRTHWTNDEPAPSPDEWLAAATEHRGSWWDDWATWIGDRAGGRRPPPAMGSNDHPVLGDAPGTYVHQ